MNPVQIIIIAGEKELAVFVAQLAREGIAFTAEPGQLEGNYKITIHGY